MWTLVCQYLTIIHRSGGKYPPLSPTLRVGAGKEIAAWEQNYLWPQVSSCRTISLPSFNGLQCKLAKIALFIYLI